MEKMYSSSVRWHPKIPNLNLNVDKEIGDGWSGKKDREMGEIRQEEKISRKELIHVYEWYRIDKNGDLEDFGLVIPLDWSRATPLNQPKDMTNQSLKLFRGK